MNKQTKVVLLNGGSPQLILKVASTLLARGAIVALYQPDIPEAGPSIVAELANDAVFDVGALPEVTEKSSTPAQIVLDRCGRLDGVANLYVPTANITTDSIEAYVKALKEDIFTTGALMAKSGSEGMIVNQFLLPTLFADSPLGVDIAAARGAVSAYTRSACVRFGKSGVRVAGLFVGLLDLPETRALASERVNAATTPLGRWIETVDVAEAVAFLTLESGYMSGQGLVLDGGMTSGVTGT